LKHITDANYRGKCYATQVDSDGEQVLGVGFVQELGSSKNKEKRKYIKNKEGQSLQIAKERKAAKLAARNETCTNPSDCPSGMQHGKVKHLRVHKHAHLYQYSNDDHQNVKVVCNGSEILTCMSIVHLY